MLPPLRTVLTLVLVASCAGVSAFAKPRVIVLADMGNEPDEEQQIVHLLLHANELDIEGFVAVTGKYLRMDPQPELFFQLIGGYAQVVDNLRLHAPGWPDAGALQAVVAAGQRRYGMADTGPGKATPGSRLIERALLRDDPRPLHVIVNAGSNTFAQALLDLESRLTPAEFSAALARLRVFEKGAQDNAGAWIVSRWPSIHWIRSNYQTYAYAGPSIDGGQDNKGISLELGPHTWQPYAYSGLGQHQWALEHVKGNHGPLLALWPIRQFPRGGVSFLEGGGTIPFLRLLPNGLNDPDHPDWGGWGGRYATVRTPSVWSKHGDVRVDEESYGPFAMFDELSDTWTDPLSGTTHNANIFAPVWRWRTAFFNEFAARADWCIQPFHSANHPPVLSIDGDTSTAPLRCTVAPGGLLELDASASSDPDGDALDFAWWLYREPGTPDLDVSIESTSSSRTRILAPAGSAPGAVHLILEVTDHSLLHPLTRYRRILIEITPP
jgi:hypothetical protein